MKRMKEKAAAQQFKKDQVYTKSKILSDKQIENLTANLDGYYRTMNWDKVFDKDQDGCSLITFFKSCKESATSILLIEDLDGYKFGAFCLEAW